MEAYKNLDNVSGSCFHRNSKTAYEGRPIYAQDFQEGSSWKMVLVYILAFTFLSLGIFYSGAARAQAPEIYSSDGKYLGNLSANVLDPNSVNNPIGRYGSPLSSDSINNPIGRYGSPLSNQSVNNPLANDAPRIVAPRRGW